ncbi:MAG: nucleotidyltransferase family protein [Acidimicrobiales bacterium]
MSGAGPAPPVERLGRALVELTRRPAARSADAVDLLDQLEPDRFVELACQHRVPGIVHRALADLGVDDDSFAGLRAVYQMASLAHGRCLLELKSVTDALADLDHPWMVVKGPVLVEIGYRDPGARLYEDLDIVVAGSDLAAAMDSIQAAGGHVTDLNWPLAIREGRAEVPMRLPAGMLADIHWHLLVTPNVRARFRVSMDELFDRRRFVPVNGMEVPTLDPIDGILYLCAHGSLSGGHQLIWLKDLDAMLEREPPDWDEFVRRARRSRLALVAAVQLDRARLVLGTPVPEPVVEALAAGAPWWRWWRRRERRVGMTRWGGDDRTGRTFVAATSHGSLASSAQLMRSLVGDVLRPAMIERLGGGSVAPDGTPDLYRPVGGDAERRRYLRLAGSGRWR